MKRTLLSIAIVLPTLAAAAQPGFEAGFYPGAEADFLAKSPALVQTDSTARVQTQIADIKEGKLAPGCIGRDIETCLATLAQVFVVSSRDDMTGTLGAFQKPKQDVMGKSIGANFASVDLFIPGKDFRSYGLGRDHITVDLSFGEGHLIDKVDFNLPGRLYIAETEEDYATTGLSESFRAMTMAQCPDKSALDAMQYFHSQVKPKLKFRGKSSDVNWEGASEGRTMSAEGLSYCGATFDAVSISGHDTQLIDDHNDTGYFSGFSLIFSPEPRAPLKKH